MTKKFLFIAGLSFSFFYSMALAASTMCPCPGPCCPDSKNEAKATINPSSLSDITDYLSPWANNKSKEQIEKQLNHYKENSQQYKNS